MSMNKSKGTWAHYWAVRWFDIYGDWHEFRQDDDTEAWAMYNRLLNDNTGHTQAVELSEQYVFTPHAFAEAGATE